MAKVLSSISGNLISAASAGYAPTNSADVSAIASGYQVVSATATQLYAGTAYLTSVNDTPVSASRAGNAANASLATSAYYDGTGRLISALPDSAAVSSIASSYAESAASGKLDTSAQVVTATAGDGTYVTSINGMGISGQGGGGAQVVTSTGSSEYQGASYVSEINGSGLSATQAYADSNGRDLGKLVDSAACSAIASAYQVVSSVGDDGVYITSINGSALSGVGGGGGGVVTATAGADGYVTSINGSGISGAGGGDAFPVIYNSGNVSAELTTGYYVNTSRPSLILSSTANIYPRFIVTNGKNTGAKGSYYLSDAFEFTTGTAGGSGTKVLRVDPQQISSKNFLLFGPSGSTTYGTLALRGSNSNAYVLIGSGSVEHTNYVRPSAISSWWNVYDHVNSASANWGGGASVVTSTASGTYMHIGGTETAVSGINESGILASYANTANIAYTAGVAEEDTSGRSIASMFDSLVTLYDAFTAVSSMLNTYSSYFSSISAKVDSTAIGVE